MNSLAKYKNEDQAINLKRKSLLKKKNQPRSGKNVREKVLKKKMRKEKIKE